MIDVDKAWEQLTERIAQNRAKAATQTNRDPFERAWLVAMAKVAQQQLAIPAASRLIDTPNGQEPEPATTWRQTVIPPDSVVTPEMPHYLDDDLETSVDPLLVIANPWEPNRITETWERIHEDGTAAPTLLDLDLRELKFMRGDTHAFSLYLVNGGHHRTARFQYLNAPLMSCNVFSTDVIIPPADVTFDGNIASWDGGTTVLTRSYSGIENPVFDLYEQNK